MPTSFEPPSSPNDCYTTAEFEDPLALYLNANPETRANIILNHPLVYGFVYIIDGIITKAFLPKQSIDWAANKKYIAAVSGTPQEFTPFRVLEQFIFGDTPHLTEPVKFSENVKTTAIGKFIKDNRKKLKNLPSLASSDAKAKSLIVVNFPIVLPLVKGRQFEEGSVEDKQIVELFESQHELYDDFFHLKVKAHVLDASFFELEQDCPLPDTIPAVNLNSDLPLKVLFSHNEAFNLIKQEIDKFKKDDSTKEPSLLASPEKVPTVPQEVAVPDQRTIVTSTSSTQDQKLIEKNERLIAFLQIFFSRPEYDRTGNITSLLPGQITDEALELLTSNSSTADQARALADALDALAIDVSHERTYLSRAADFPYMSQTVLTYMLQTHIHSHAIDKNYESIKKSFNLLTFLPPPSASTDDYQRYINASRNTEVELLLEQPAEKRSALKKDIFTKGKQDTIDDVVSFIGNIIIFARFWMKMSENSTTQPTIIQMITEIADLISTGEYRSFNDKYIVTNKYMPHTLVSYIFNISSVFIRMAKNPSVVRRFKIENFIDPHEIRLATIMTSTLINNLQVCSATSSLQVLFANPPSSFEVFCPHLVKTNTTTNNNNNPGTSNNNGSKRPGPSDDGKNKHQKLGSIENNTGKRLFFPKGLSQKYCSDFLDTSTSCRHGDNCHFVHTFYPSGFPSEDVKLMEEHLKNNPGYSVKPNVKKVS